MKQFSSQLNGLIWHKPMSCAASLMKIMAVPLLILAASIFATTSSLAQTLTADGQEKTEVVCVGNTVAIQVSGDDCPYAAPGASVNGATVILTYDSSSDTWNGSYPASTPGTFTVSASDSIGIAWDNASLSYTTGGTIPPTVENDDSKSWSMYLNPVNGDIFDLDIPGCSTMRGININHTAETHVNFSECTGISLGDAPGPVPCSNVSTYSYKAAVDADAKNIALNSLNSSHISPLPSSPQVYMTPR